MTLCFFTKNPSVPQKLTIFRKPTLKPSSSIDTSEYITYSTKVPSSTQFPTSIPSIFLNPLIPYMTLMELKRSTWIVDTIMQERQNTIKLQNPYEAR